VIIKKFARRKHPMSVPRAYCIQQRKRYQFVLHIFDVTVQYLRLGCMGLETIKTFQKSDSIHVAWALGDDPETDILPQWKALALTPKLRSSQKEIIRNPK